MSMHGHTSYSSDATRDISPSMREYSNACKASPSRSPSCSLPYSLPPLCNLLKPQSARIACASSCCSVLRRYPLSVSELGNRLGILHLHPDAASANATGGAKSSILRHSTWQVPQHCTQAVQQAMSQRAKHRSQGARHRAGGAAAARQAASNSVHSLRRKQRHQA